MRKSAQVRLEAKKVKEEADKIVEKLKEIELLAHAADLEESAKTECTRLAVNALCEKENMFCGIILSVDDILNIVRIAIEKNDSIKIPFNLYYND